MVQRVRNSNSNWIKALLVHSNRKQKRYLVAEGRNRSRNYCHSLLSAVVRGWGRSLAMNAAGRRNGSREKEAELSVADIGVRNTVLINPKIIPSLFM